MLAKAAFNWSHRYNKDSETYVLLWNIITILREVFREVFIVFSSTKFK